MTNLPTTTTRADIAARLRILAHDMTALAVDMEYYGGFGPMATHGVQLYGAAIIARQWADAVEAEQ